MNFLDEVTISIAGGHGGNGCLSFLRRANYAKGGPDGGCGGQGGSVYLVGDSSLTTLIDLRYQPEWKAANGQPGGSSLKRGANGASISIRVPVGTTIIDDETLSMFADITADGQSVCVASGGTPGRGNASFKSSTNRAPRQLTHGGKGVRRRLRLQLKLMADVGLLGLPNAGKSTLLSTVTASKPRIADFPFTTIRPYVGVVQPSTDNAFVMADVPGLIKGAADGQGLGTRFMRHLTRASMLLHLVEVAPHDGSDPFQNLLDIEDELQSYSSTLGSIPVISVLTKIDLLPPEVVDSLIEGFRIKLCDRKVFAISAVTGKGVQSLVNYLGVEVERMRNSREESADSLLEHEQRLNQLAQEVLNRSLEERRKLSKVKASDLRMEEED